MASLNKVQIIGNLGRDPETRYLPSGDAVTNITVATTEKWKDKATGEQKEATEWHRASFFAKLAEIAGQYLKKGSSVYVEGKLQTRKYTDRDGIERYQTEIKGEQLQMLGSRQDAAHPPAQHQATQQRQAAPQRQQAKPQQPASAGFDDMDSDDIPF